MEDKALNGKVVVISGGTKGVGKAVAERCALHGASVVIGGRDEKSAQTVIDKIKSCGSDGLFVHTELTRVEDCKKLFDEAYAKFGKIDGFFNYAGVTPVSPLDTCDEATFDSVMDINFKSAFFCCQSAIKYMRLNGGGSIILAGSAHAWGGQKDRAAYACSKGVLRVLSEHIARNYANEKIRCNYLVLGWTPTEGELALRKSQGESEVELRNRAKGILPMGRMCETTDYTDAVIYMLGDASEVMTGSVFRITAGEYI